MTTTIRGKSFEITEAIISYTKEKYAKLSKYSDHLEEVEVILDGNSKRGFEVEVIAHYNGERLVAKSENKDLYGAIDRGKSKIKSIIQKQKVTFVKKANSDM